MQLSFSSSTDENNTEKSTVSNPTKTYQKNTEMSNDLNPSDNLKTTYIKKGKTRKE